MVSRLLLVYDRRLLFYRFLRFGLTLCAKILIFLQFGLLTFGAKVQFFQRDIRMFNQNSDFGRALLFKRGTH